MIFFFFKLELLFLFCMRFTEVNKTFVLLTCCQVRHKELSEVKRFILHTWGQLSQYVLVTPRHYDSQTTACDAICGPNKQIVRFWFATDAAAFTSGVSVLLLFLTFVPFFLSPVQVFFWVPLLECCCGTYHPSLPMSLWSSPSLERS